MPKRWLVLVVCVAATLAAALAAIASSKSTAYKPLIGKPIASPAHPVAGKRFSVTFKVRRSDTGRRLVRGKMVCNPSIAGRLIRHAESLKGGRARVSLAVSRKAAGKLLKVKLTIRTTGGSSATRVTTFRIRNRTLQKADAIFFGGTVLTMDPARPQAEAVAVRGDEIVAVGGKHGVLRLRGKQTRMVDLAGRTLLPGFNDAHAHWIGNPDLAGLTQEEAIATALRGGFTSVSELFVTPDQPIETLKALSAEGKLPFRVNAYLAVNSRGAYAEKYGIWFGGQYTQGQVLGPHLRIGGAKIFVDGWLLSRPYSNRPDYYGRTWWAQDELNTIVQQLADGGWQIATHANGDAAIDMILEAYKAALPDADNGRRFRIEHLDVLRDDQIPTLEQYGILASIQLPWFTTDWLVEPSIEEVLGPDRLAWLGRWRDLVDAGVRVVGSTDQPWSGCPVKPCSAMGAIALAVTRVGANAVTPPQYMLDQRLTVAEALEAMTSAGAYSTFEEKTKGTISPHKLADLVILDHNPLTTDADKLADIAVLATIVGGHTEYCAAGATSLCP